MVHSIIDVDLILIVTIGSIAILNVVLFWFMPRLTRPDLYFAVTVPPSFRDEPEAKSILGRYRTELILLTLLALIAFVAGVTWLGVRFVSTGIIIQLITGLIAFYLARRRTLPYAVQPSGIREVELHEHDWIVPGGWIAAAGPFILLAVCVGYLWIHGLEPAAHLGSHWSLTRQPNHSGTRTLIVYLLSMAGILALLSTVLYGVARWVRPVNVSGPKRVRELKFRRTTAAIVLAAEYYITLQAAWIVLAPRHGGLLAVGLVPFGFVFILVVIVVLARLGQGGSRVPAAEQESPASAVPTGDRTPDRYWKLGMFYFNRDDSAVFVEKRFGLGYSLNFARPTAWVILALALLAPLVPILAHLTQFLPKGRV
jgi:uncharacterized membrane protein